MAYNLYPDPPERPLELSASGSAGDDSGLLSFTPAGSPGIHDTIYIRIAVSDPDCLSASGPDPIVYLRAGTGGVFGNEKRIPAPIHDNPIEAGTTFYVGDADMFREDNDVFRIQIGPLNKVPGSWEIRVKNTHTASRHFVWVLADSDTDTSQPWLDITSTTSPAGELNFYYPRGRTTSQSIHKTLRVANKGTGPLKIKDNIGVIKEYSDNSSFEINSVPGEIKPNAFGDLEIVFNPADTTSEYSHTYDIHSSDTNAIHDILDAKTLHNRTVVLKASYEPLPPPINLRIVDIK